MKKSIHLGKILFLFLFSLNLFGSIHATIDKPFFNQGDEVTLSIQARGNDIEVPKIKKILEFPIIHTHIDEIISNQLNGEKTKNLEFTFLPNRTISTPLLKFKIDEQEYAVAPMTIEKIPPVVSKSADMFQLLFELPHRTFYVGEPFIGQIIFRYKKETEILKQTIEPFFGDDFETKLLDTKEENWNNDSKELIFKYLFIPKKEGLHTLQHQFIEVKFRENKTNFKKRIFSDIQNISVITLPKGVAFVGNYTFEAFVDTTEVTNETPINLTLQIKGDGDIEKIPPFPITLPNQHVFNSKPIIKSSFIDGKIMGVFTQKIAITTDKSFTIPSFKFQYFDTVSKTTKQLVTQPIKVNIKNNENEVNTATSQIHQIKTISHQKQKTKEENSLDMEVIGLFIGFFLSSFISYMIIKKILKVKRREENLLVVKIKKAKNDKELFDILLPYVTNLKLEHFIKQLERNIYMNEKNKIDKKQLLEIINPKKKNEEDDFI